MKRTGILLAVALGVSLHAGCKKTDEACTLIGCDDRVTIVVADAGDVYAAELPLAIEACVDGTCGQYTVSELNGQIVCNAPGDTDCMVEDDGDLMLELRVDVAPGATATISVANEGGTVLFDGTEEVETEDQFPNGPECGPACTTGEVQFTAEAQSS